MDDLGSISLLDEQPALAELVPARQREAARRALTARSYRAPAGRWHPDALLDAARPRFGILVLDGLLLRDVAVAHTTCGELVGPGELLRPWDRFGERAPTPFEIEWKVLEPMRIAVLDERFAEILAAWPPLVDEFLQRAVERSHSLALHVAIHCLKRVDLSLLVLFSHLADRFGRVTPKGILIPIRLTHQDLGKLIGSPRQSISASLPRLVERGLIVRAGGDRWLLHHELPNEIEAMLQRRARRTAEVAEAGSR
jgi:CRP/FNR family cyclic AMP-dependent transcriptional regulator